MRRVAAAKHLGRVRQTSPLASATVAYVQLNVKKKEGLYIWLWHTMSCTRFRRDISLQLVLQSWLVQATRSSLLSLLNWSFGIWKVDSALGSLYAAILLLFLKPWALRKWDDYLMISRWKRRIQMAFYGNINVSFIPIHCLLGPVSDIRLFVPWWLAQWINNNFFWYLHCIWCITHSYKRDILTKIPTDFSFSEKIFSR